MIVESAAEGTTTPERDSPLVDAHFWGLDDTETLSYMYRLLKYRVRKINDTERSIVLIRARYERLVKVFVVASTICTAITFALEVFGK